MIESRQARALLWPTVATLLVLAVLLGLGSWQLQRKVWKEGLIAQREALAQRAPVDPGDALFTSGAVAEYTRVSLSGRFLHDRERYWFADGREGTGFHVFTPFEVGGGRIVWLNRGYIPQRLRNPATRPAGQITGLTTVTGVVRFPGERNRFTPANDVAKNLWFWRDLDALQTSTFAPGTPYAPVMVDVDVAPGPAGSKPWDRPEGGTAQATIFNRHLEYALTWFGLAATLIVVFCVFAAGRLAQFPK